MSIGTELETQFLCPVLVNQNKIVGVGKDFETVMKYEILNTPTHILQMYGDAFADSAFAKTTKKFRETEIYFGDKNDRSSRTTLSLDYDELYADAEFVNTFPENVSVQLSKTHIVHYILQHVKRSAQEIINYLDTYSKILLCQNRSFPYRYLAIDNEEKFVTEAHSAQKISKIKILQQRLKIINQYKERIDESQLEDLEILQEQTIGKLQKLQRVDYANTQHFKMGFLSTEPYKEIVKKARFVPQCTLGFPITNSILIFNLLYQWARDYLQGTEEIAIYKKIKQEFETIYPTIETRMIEEQIPLNRFDLIVNYCFLFIYSMSTRLIRKVGSIFIIRNSFQDLAHLLTFQEKRLIEYLIPDRFSEIFLSIHFSRPHLLANRKASRQRLGQVSLITDQQLKKVVNKIYTPEQANRIALSLPDIKIYVEFRLLNPIICNILGVENLTLDMLSKLKV
jgi:hypothetical protein